MNYIYLLQEREFLKTNESIYKIGRTAQYYETRLSQYPKGSKTILVKKCNNCYSMETRLLKDFRAKFINRTDIGKEYFEGDVEEMINIITTVLEEDEGYDEEDDEDAEEKIKKPFFECDDCKQNFVSNFNKIRHQKTCKVAKTSSFSLLQKRFEEQLEEIQKLNEEIQKLNEENRELKKKLYHKKFEVKIYKKIITKKINE
jgi:hypothetical protein